MFSRIRKYVPIWVLAVALTVILLLLLTAVARSSYAVADFVNSYLATPLRVVMAAVTRVIPFSLFELMLLMVLPALIMAIVLAFRDKSAWRLKIRRIFIALGIIGILYSGYLTVMTIPYNVAPLSDKLEIEEDKSITAEELYSATLYARDRVNELADRVERDGGLSIAPHTKDEISHLVSEAYEAVRVEYPFFYNFESRAKPVYFSEIMSDMGISGIYTYFTGEANVNTSYPDYCYAFTVAHEFAHQRGINRENEANFMAFFVLSHSDDDFLKYSAYLNIYEYLASALYSADKEMYRQLHSGLDEGARFDSATASEITRKHVNSPLYKLMHDVNDAYLKSNGTEGIITYGYVVRIAVGYLNKN